MGILFVIDQLEAEKILEENLKIRVRQNVSKGVNYLTHAQN